MSPVRVPDLSSVPLPTLLATLAISIPAGLAFGELDGAATWLIVGIAAVLVIVHAVASFRRAAFVSADGIRLRRFSSSRTLAWSHVASISVEPRYLRAVIRVRSRSVLGDVTDRLGLVDVPALRRILEQAAAHSMRIEFPDVPTRRGYRARTTWHHVAVTLNRPDAGEHPGRTPLELAWFAVAVAAFGSLFAGRVLLGVIDANEPASPPFEFDLETSRDLAIVSGGSGFEAAQSWAKQFDRRATDGTVDCGAPIDVPDELGPPVFIRVVASHGIWELAPSYGLEAIAVPAPWLLTQLVGLPGTESRGASRVIAAATEVWIFDADGPLRLACG